MTHHAPHHSSWRRRLLFGQSLYYVLTGLWPLLSMATFEFATGPKVDDWLVRVVAGLVVVIGLVLGTAAIKGHVHAIEIVLLSAGSALAFLAIDGWYALGGRIAPIYLADALLEIGLLIGVARTRRRHRTVHHHHPPPYIVDPAQFRDARRAMPLADPHGRKRHRPLS